MNDPTPASAERAFIPLSICVLTISDTRTEDTDKSGKLLADRLAAAGHSLHEKRIVPDDIYRIRAVVSGWIADPEVNAVISTGGHRGHRPRRHPGGGEPAPRQDHRRLRRSVQNDLVRRDQNLDDSVPGAGRGRERDLRLLPSRLVRRLPHRVGQAHRRSARLPHATVQPRRADAAAAGEIAGSGVVWRGRSHGRDHRYPCLDSSRLQGRKGPARRTRVAVARLATTAAGRLSKPRSGATDHVGCGGAPELMIDAVAPGLHGGLRCGDRQRPGPPPRASFSATSMTARLRPIVSTSSSFGIDT